MLLRSLLVLTPLLLLPGCFGGSAPPPDPATLPVIERWDTPPDGALGERLTWILDLLNDRVDAPVGDEAPYVWHYALLDRRSADELAAAFDAAASLAPYELVGLVERIDDTHWIVGLLRSGQPVLLSFDVDATDEARIEEARLLPWELDAP